jgi:hypothetical protein
VIGICAWDMPIKPGPPGVADMPSRPRPPIVPVDAEPNELPPPGPMLPPPARPNPIPDCAVEVIAASSAAVWAIACTCPVSSSTSRVPPPGRPIR